MTFPFLKVYLQSFCYSRKITLEQFSSDQNIPPIRIAHFYNWSHVCKLTIWSMFFVLYYLLFLFFI